MVDNDGRRRTASIPAAFAFVALTVAACGGTGPETAGVDPVVAGTLHVCSQCHGPGGRSTTASTFPRLAGQQKDYIVAQLTAFRDKTRADPHAKTYMWGMAARLSDATIEGIAAYYASQAPVAGEPDTSPQTAAGEKIFTEGNPSASLPACMSCHREKAEWPDPASGGTAPSLSRPSVGSVRGNGAGQRDHAREFERSDLSAD